MSAIATEQCARERATPRAQARLRLSKAVAVEVLLVGLIVLAALLARLPDPEGPRAKFPDLFDEGIRAEQLLLMSHGYRPFRDIYAAQGLALLDLLYPFYVLFGGTLGAARLGVGILSTLGIVGAWFAARQVGGRIGALAAAGLLALSPAYLEGSRLALAEVPSIGPALWAIGCGLRWRYGGGRGWLAAMALLGTAAVLIKPLALPVAAPLLVLLLRPRLRGQDVLLGAGLALAFAAGTILIMGPAEVYDQIVNYRVGAAQGGSWQWSESYKTVILEPFRGQVAVYLAAGVGALLLFWRDSRSGLALLLYAVATTTLLLRYYPLHPKHLVYLYPPLCLLAGAGLGEAARLARLEGRQGLRMRLASVAAAGLLAGWHLASYPVGAAGDPARLGDEDQDLHSFDADATLSLQLLTRPDEFVLTDHPYVAALARRLVPPELVDPSKGRMRAGVLSDRMVLEAAERYDVRTILIWADRLKRLGSLPTWLERNYQHAHVFGTRIAKTRQGKDRTIYLRKDTDLDAARAALEGSLAVREAVDFRADGEGGTPLRLLGHRVSREVVEPAQQFTLTIGVVALEAMKVDYHVHVSLVDERGESVDSQEHDLDGGARGTSLWQPGRWLFRSFMIAPEEKLEPGEYQVRVMFDDPKTGRALRPRPRAGGPYTVPDLGEVTVATVRVE